MLRMTPPSARTAEPLIEIACELATNATTAATSSGVWKRLRSEVGRTVAKNCFSISAGVAPCSLAMRSTNRPAPSDAVGPAGMEFYSDASAGDGFRHSARDGHLAGLGHSVVDHFHGNVLCRFAG